jgi:hypothetical protein
MTSFQVLSLEDLKKDLILSLKFVGDNLQKKKQKKCNDSVIVIATTSTLLQVTIEDLRKDLFCKQVFALE